MIAIECFTKEWQTRKRAELGGCDPVLLEKTIHAFAALGKLKAVPEAMWYWAEAMRLRHGA